MDMQNPEAALHLSKIRETTLAEVVEAASFPQKRIGTHSWHCSWPLPGIPNRW